MPVPRPDPATVGSLAAAPAASSVPAVKVAAPGADPIGNLIRGGEPGAPRPAEAKPDPRVISVQKALAKLGYGPLKADGYLGATTRQALERFERDNKLPVTGGLGIRTTRQLAAASGTQIE
nr:peptidoglycan-binding domain-containing protein [Enterovirga sp. DB1703]